jgi:hypothetical protein
VLTSCYARRENVARGKAKTTTGFYTVPAKVCALVVNKSSQNEVYIVCRSGTFPVARPSEEGWVAIAVDPGDILYGYVDLHEYKC